MIVLDTSVWIEFLRMHEPIATRVEEEITAGRVLGLSWIVGELLQGAKGAYEIRVLEMFWQQLPKISEESVWIEAGKLSCANKYFEQGVGLIDVATIVAARRANAKVWTLDKKLSGVLGRGARFEL